MKFRHNEKGFTLVELIVVIAVLGILSLILIPQFSLYGDKAMGTAALSDTRSILSIAIAHNMDNVDKLDQTAINKYMGLDDYKGSNQYDGGVDKSQSKFIYVDRGQGKNTVMYQYRRGGVVLTANMDTSSQKVYWGITGIDKTSQENRWKAICDGLKVNAADPKQITNAFGDPMIGVVGP